MNRLAIAAAALAVLGSTGAFGQPAPSGDQQRAPNANVQEPAPDQRNVQQPVPDRRNTQQPAAPSQEDAAAYLDARVAALHSGLQLTPDQERLWPPFEKAYRDFAQTRPENAVSAASDNDLPARVERRAEALIRRGMTLKALAEAGTPLWRSLDDAQKGRFLALIRENIRARFAERSGQGFSRGQGFDRGPRNFEDRGRDANVGQRQFRFGGRDGYYGDQSDAGPRGFGRDGDRFGFYGPRGFERRDFYRRDLGPRGFGRDGEGYGFGRPGFGRDDGDRGFGPRGFRGRDGDGDRFGFAPRDYGRRDFDGPRRDGGYGGRFEDRGGLRRGGPGFRNQDQPTDERGPRGEQRNGPESERF
jgi:zinc resistance-associated protein